jgi:hypothetical protein
MADEEEDVKTHLEQIQLISAELAGKLDKIHEQEFRKVIIQPILVGMLLIIAIACYFYMPSGILGVAFVSFLFSWSYPALQVVIWSCLAMIVGTWYRALV